MSVADKIEDTAANTIQSVHAEGWCLVKGVIPEEECEKIRQGIYDVARANRKDYAIEGLTFLPAFINHNQSYAKYIADPKVLAVVEGIFGSHPRVSYTSALINEPNNKRGSWHADWPFNAQKAGHIPGPYPLDVIFHLTTLWMISPFTVENGGTLILPRSHRKRTNPTCKPDGDWTQPFEGEMNATGPSGSVLILDSRMWHATAKNISDKPRVGLAIRYAPWWLNLDILMPGSEERKMMVDEPGMSENEVPRLKQEIYNNLPNETKPLFRHWLHAR